MNNIKRTFTLTLLVITALGMMAQTNQNPVNQESGDANVILGSQELPELHVHKTMLRDWITNVDQLGKPHGRPGVIQEVEIRGIKARVQFAEFSSENEARLAAAFYITNVASVFNSGIWGTATNKFIVDESWYSLDSGNTAILMRSRETLFLVSCRTGTREQQADASVKLAVRITDKIKTGKRVILPQAN